MNNPVLIDVETCGRPAHSGKLLLVGWCLLGEPVRMLEWPLHRDSWDPDVLELQGYLADPKRPVISMTKYDPRYLRIQGWEVTGPFYDIQAMAWVMNENQQLSLDSLAKRYCSITMDKRLRRSAGTVIFRTDEGIDVPLPEMGPDQAAWTSFMDYCRRDVEAEVELFQTLWGRLEDSMWLDYFRTEEVPFTGVLLDMEVAGMPVNVADSEVLRLELEDRSSALQRELREVGKLPESFNLNSGLQMAAYLYQPYVELEDSLDLGEWAVGALKSCLDGEHDDCFVWAEGNEIFDGEYGDVCVQTLLPVGFTLTTLGRTQVHGVWTFKGRGLPPGEKTPSGDRFSTASPVLRSSYEAAQDPWVTRLLEYRRTEKMLTTYLRPMPERAVVQWGEDGGWDGHRLYGRFNQTGTKTGRLSSSDPNMQNMPAHGPLGEAMRGLFQGRLVVGDYSQLEPRLAAHFSEDPRLLAVYREGRDAYVDLAEGIFGHEVEKDSDERGVAKVLLLAMNYGAYEKKVAQILTINSFPTSISEAKGYLDEMQRYYARFFAWREAVIARVKVRGYVQTIGGRHRRLKAAFADRKNWKNVGYGERQAVNAIIQGSAGDIVRRVMVEGNWQHEQRMLAQVHDELVWEWDGVTDPSTQQLEYIQSVGETAHGFDLRVPLKFEPHFGHSWFTAKEGDIEMPESDATSDFEEF